MARRYPKFAVMELDNVELDYNAEYEALAEDIYYDLDKQKTMKDKIDTVGNDSVFLYVLVNDLVIPAFHSKVVADCIEIGDNCLEVEGILEIT